MTKIMALQNFRTHELSIQFYRECKEVKLPHAIKDQLMRAASSITLNLSEGSAKPSYKERLRYYSIAFGSIREIQMPVTDPACPSRCPRCLIA